MRRAAPALLALAAVVASAAPAAAVERVVQDRQGRPMLFDVRAPGVDLGFYARTLRNAIHGDEVRTARIVIVPRRRVPTACGAPEAAGCYRSGTIVVPAGTGGDVERTLLHEYGHHIDRSVPHPEGREPNGTPRWWAARKISARLSAGLVAHDYSRGWSRAIGEIFAEDYVSLHLKGSHSIGWLRAPGAGVLRALRRDLTGRPTGPAPREAAPDAPPGTRLPDGTPGVQVTRDGVLGPGQRVSIPFGLLGPGRRVSLTVRAAGLGGAVARVRAEVVCDGVLVGSAEGGDGADVAIDLPSLGPASCEASVSGLHGPASVATELTLRAEPPAAPAGGPA